MNNVLIKIHMKLQDLASREEGQDMVEYALAVGLICFGATAATKFLAAGLTSAFTGISTTLGSYTS
jgi:Flp pilus assembly pilin Flp